MVARVLVELRYLTGYHETTHRLARAGKPVLLHWVRENRSDFTEAPKPGICNEGKNHRRICLWELGPLNKKLSARS